MWSKCSSQHHRYRGQRQREKVFRAQGAWFGEGPCLLGVPLVSLPGQSPSTELWQHCLDLFPSWASLRVSEDSLLGVKDPLLCELHTDNTIPLICMSRISASSPWAKAVSSLYPGFPEYKFYKFEDLLSSHWFSAETSFSLNRSMLLYNIWPVSKSAFLFFSKGSHLRGGFI